MISTAERELADAGVNDQPAVVVGDAGYWSNDFAEGVEPAQNLEGHRSMSPAGLFRPRRNGPRLAPLDGGPCPYPVTTAAFAAVTLGSCVCSGWETIAQCPPAMSIVSAPIRYANCLSASGCPRPRAARGLAGR